MLCWEAGLTEQHWAAPTSCFLTNKWKVLIFIEIFLIFMGASRAASWFSTTIERFGLFTTHELSSLAWVGKTFFKSAKEVLFRARSFFYVLGSHFWFKDIQVSLGSVLRQELLFQFASCVLWWRICGWLWALRSSIGNLWIKRVDFWNAIINWYTTIHIFWRQFWRYSPAIWMIVQNK